MSAFFLIHLLKSIQDAAECNALNPLSLLSTHHPQEPKQASTLPTLCVDLVGCGEAYYLLTPGQIGDPDAILGGILGVLGASGSYPVAGVESAAGHALKAIAPRLLGQWLRFSSASISERYQDLDEEAETQMPSNPQPQDLDFLEPGPTLSPSYPTLDQWPSAQSLDAYGMTHWVLRQLLCLAAFAKRYHDRCGIRRLHALSLRAYNHRSRNCYPRDLPAEAAMSYPETMEYLVTTVAYEFVPIHDSISEHLLQILALKKDDDTVYSSLVSRRWIQPSHLFPLIVNTATSITPVGDLLADIDTYTSAKRFYFPRSDLFRRLLQIAGRSEYEPVVAHFAFDIVTEAIVPPADQLVESGLEPAIIAPDDVEAFLGTVGVVLKHALPSEKSPSDLNTFLWTFWSILQSLEVDENAQRIYKHLPRAELIGISRNKHANSDSKNIVSTVLERFKLEGGVAVGT
ncbi:hypothetical protein BDV93DRAFT_529553 [Ceratobasidium sp. AG-I]|nr:hypothetical protein BDV93DRAFT_529553 [Ceratobasidium sp. AG-I]